MNIVVVDTSRTMLKLVAQMLTPRGHIVTTFTDSREALNHIATTPEVDGLITSLETAPMNGIELCWSARLLGEGRRPLYIIVMSSRQTVTSLAEALDSGADDFIGKPLREEDIYARLRAAQRVTMMQRDLIRLAETDELTGLLNRRAFLERVGDHAVKAGNFGRLALVMFDIDHFKSVNDTHGHDVGDRVIRDVAALASSVAVSRGGFAGRLGGEEFMIALPGKTPDEAAAVANDLRRRCSELEVQTRRSAIKVTASFGVAGWSEGATVDHVMKQADIALYEAKGAGRNCVVTAETDLILSRTG